MHQRTGGAARLAAIVLGTLAVLLLAQCKPGTTVTVVQKQALDRLLAVPCEVELPADSSSMFKTILTSSGQLNNKIVHDCQKMMLPVGRYGPLVAIQIGDFLDRRIARAAEGVVLADIIDYGKSDYLPLNIHTRLNCLWVKGDPHDPARWQVAVRQGPSCADGDTALLSPVQPGLHVHPVAYADTGIHVPTARWGWKDSIQYIGIHCGRAWCEIGPAAFRESGATAGDSIGISDEQYVAVNDAAPSGNPSRVWGRIRPFRALAATDSMYFATPRPVAAVILKADLNDPPGQAGQNAVVLASYRARYRLPADSTTLWMKHVPGQWLIATSPTPDHWSKLTHGNFQHASSGAVRWRWSANDEALWVACTDGCCTAASIN